MFSPTSVSSKERQLHLQSHLANLANTASHTELKRVAKGIHIEEGSEDSVGHGWGASRCGGTLGLFQPNKSYTSPKVLKIAKCCQKATVNTEVVTAINIYFEVGQCLSDILHYGTLQIYSLECLLHFEKEERFFPLFTMSPKYYSAHLAAANGCTKQTWQREAAVGFLASPCPPLW